MSSLKRLPQKNITYERLLEAAAGQNKLRSQEMRIQEMREGGGAKTRGVTANQRRSREYFTPPALSPCPTSPDFRFSTM